MSEKKYAIHLSIAELNHVAGALAWATQDGSYYGNRQQYAARHKRIVKQIAAALKVPMPFSPFEIDPDDEP